MIGYLKGLGVLRVISLQADPAARGRWRDGAFELLSELSDERVAGFLLDEYSPAPVLSPWNGGSGFFSKDRKDALLWIEQSEDTRFSPYRETLAGARAALETLHIDDKPGPDQKLALIRELRRVLPDEALAWLDAAIVVTGGHVAYPPLLGSGGNDGRFDFSNNYAQAVVACLTLDRREESAATLAAALDGSSIRLQRKLSLGHLNRDTSPTNSPLGEADSLGNPWDLVLAVEGSLLLVAGAARRHGASIGGNLVAPFTVRSTGAGYGSAVGGESGRAELWLPLWSGWASRSEVATLVRESRAQVGRRQAVSGLDFARAAGELGVARGIDAFERYAVLERAGQSNLAVPAGRISVSPRPAAAALQSIDGWLNRVLRLGRDDRSPNSLEIVARRLEQAAFQVASRGERQDVCMMLEALGAAEQALSRSTRSAETNGIRPLFNAPSLPWAEAADDGTPEFAVAVAIGSLHDRTPRTPTLRDYLHGTEDGGRAYDEDRRHAIDGNSVVAVLAGIHARRHLDVARSGGDAQVRLDFEEGSWCDLDSARMLAIEALDEKRIMRLIRGLALLSHRTVPRLARRNHQHPAAAPAFDLLAFAWMGQRAAFRRARPQMEGGVAWDRLRPRPGWAARLAAGATESVLHDAVLSLRMAGVQPMLTVDDVLAGSRPHERLKVGQRLAAALLVQVAPGDIRALRHRLAVGEEETPSANDQMEKTA